MCQLHIGLTNTITAWLFTRNQGYFLEPSQELSCNLNRLACCLEHRTRLGDRKCVRKNKKFGLCMLQFSNPVHPNQIFIKDTKSKQFNNLLSLPNSLWATFVNHRWDVPTIGTTISRHSNQSLLGRPHRALNSLKAAFFINQWRGIILPYPDV